MRLLAILVLAAACAQASASDVIVQVDGKCPTGWYKSGGYCKPFKSTTKSGKNAVAREDGRDCPVGWYKVGKFCTKRASK